MQALNSSSVQYAPGPVPADAAALRQYIENELRSIQTAIMALAVGHIDKSYTAPLKLRDGDIRYADGTSWNPVPATGAGIYYYNGTIWKLLG